MNQAQLHRLLPHKGKSSQELFDQRLATNLTLIQKQFFSLYPEERYAPHFQKLLKLLPKLFLERPEVLKSQDIAPIKIGKLVPIRKADGHAVVCGAFQ